MSWRNNPEAGGDKIMTTLLSENKEDSLEIITKGFELEDGDMLLLASQNEIDKMGEWMGKHGLFGVYFNPADDIKKYSEFMFVSLNEDETVAIRLYK